MIIDKLLNTAKSICVHRKISPEVSVGEVSAALITTAGNIYTGICIVVPCGMGFCAEHSAIADMLKHGESKIEYIVAVRDEKIIPPCGRCRELMRQIDEYNYSNTKVIIDSEEHILLRDLLPKPF